MTHYKINCTISPDVGYGQLLLITNRKLYMGIRLTLRSMTLDDLELL